MTVTSARKLRDIAIESGNDPKGAILSAVGDISGFEPFHNLILVGTHVRPEKTKGGIIRPDRNLAEDRFQGKVGLVLKVGPVAFLDNATAQFGGMTVEEGDWVVYRASDGYEMFFVDDNGRDGTPCRLLEDVHIKARVVDPEMVY